MIQENGPAPYATTPGVISIIERFRNHGLQTPFTLEVLKRAGITSALAPRTLQALKLLDLIDDDGNPMPEFVSIQRATEDEFKDRLAAAIRAAYAEVFRYVDPATDSRERVRDAFRGYVPQGQQGRMVLLFLGLCEFADIVPEGQHVVRKRTRAKPKGAALVKAPPARTTAEVPAPTVDVVDFAPAQPSTEQHPFIVGLLESLPAVGSTWFDAKREDWLSAARAVFNMLYERPPDDSEVYMTITPGGTEG